MKNCLHCKYADWKRTGAGKLHPSGDGLCKYPWKMPQLPGSMCWIGQIAPKPGGGFISRKNELKDHCPYFAQSSAVPEAQAAPLRRINAFLSGESSEATAIIKDAKALLAAPVQAVPDGSRNELIKRLRDTPNWRKEAFGFSWKDMTTTFDRAPFEAADEIEKLLNSIAIAYGYLWHANNDPDAPWNYSPERAAREARKILRDLITHEDRGRGINAVRETIAAAPQPPEDSTAQSSAVACPTKENIE